MKTSRAKIFLVDGRAETKESVCDALDGGDYDLTYFTNADACLSELEQNGCHLLIAGFKTAGMDGITLLSKAKRIAPWTPVMMISELEDIPVAVEAMKCGAEDFVQKPLDGKVFRTKVKEILLRSAFDSPSAEFKLTKNEKKVLRLILDGCGNKEIAFKMRIALRTVEFHRSNIFHKFGAKNVVDLTKKAIKLFAPENGSQL